MSHRCVFSTTPVLSEKTLNHPLPLATDSEAEASLSVETDRADVCVFGDSAL